MIYGKQHQLDLWALEFLLENPGATIVRVTASEAQAKKVFKGAHFDALHEFSWLDRMTL